MPRPEDFDPEVGARPYILREVTVWQDADDPLLFHFEGLVGLPKPVQHIQKEIAL